MHELAAQEIAQLLGESLDNVKIRLNRARMKLRLSLQLPLPSMRKTRNPPLTEEVNRNIIRHIG
jgi:hypothetical protein